MRALAVPAAVVLIACGGSATPPPQSPSTDTSSLETSSSSSKDESKEAAPAASDAPAPAAAPAASAAPAADAPTSGSSGGGFHPAPSVTGLIDGSAFAPKVAQILAPMKKDGRIAVTLTEATDCPGGGDAKADHATLTMVVPWQDGYKADLSSLKVSGKKGPGEIGFSPGKKASSASFKPSGTVTVVSAPMGKGSKGKLKIDLQSGDYMLAGDLDIEVCVAPK
jgi:hypothetical protein